MSVESKKRRRRRRRAKLGIFMRHELLTAAWHDPPALTLERVSAQMRAIEDGMRAILAASTPEERFVDALARGWPIYAHPETAARAKEAGLAVQSHPLMQRGELIAVKPAHVREPPRAGHVDADAARADRGARLARPRDGADDRALRSPRARRTACGDHEEACDDHEEACDGDGDRPSPENLGVSLAKKNRCDGGLRLRLSLAKLSA